MRAYREELGAQNTVLPRVLCKTPQNLLAGCSFFHALIPIHLHTAMSSMNTVHYQDISTCTSGSLCSWQPFYLWQAYHPMYVAWHASRLSLERMQCSGNASEALKRDATSAVSKKLMPPAIAALNTWLKSSCGASQLHLYKGLNSSVSIVSARKRPERAWTNLTEGVVEPLLSVSPLQTPPLTRFVTIMVEVHRQR